MRYNRVVLGCEFCRVYTGIGRTFTQSIFAFGSVNQANGYDADEDDDDEEREYERQNSVNVGHHHFKFFKSGLCLTKLFLVRMLCIDV